ncbi:MAG: hypothetical protein HOO90_03080 [Methylotenera sp.]|uniref:hypothetical protein n=1 Tax=Methylotenera sp. TaxID=2051956 RepID=UPI0018379D61|nr:hypothetical protein [Methylotenera sp.]NOU24500.1 hypothetical protein [Methylotenera sp.]
MEHTPPLARLGKTKAEGVLDAPATANEITTKNQNGITKNQTMLSEFIQAGRRGLNRFEANRHHHDSVLNTTISDLQKKYGVYFSREMERVPNFKGTKTSVMRYWLDDVNMAIAIEALEAEESRND